jgi:hypothetical protein
MCPSVSASPQRLPISRLSRSARWYHATASAGGAAERPGNGEETAAARQPQRIRLWLLSDRSSVMVLVWDEDGRQPVQRKTDPDAEAGRGLMLIGALSRPWGCYALAGVAGKFVWAVCTR